MFLYPKTSVLRILSIDLYSMNRFYGGWAFIYFTIRGRRLAGSRSYWREGGGEFGRWDLTLWSMSRLHVKLGEYWCHAICRRHCWHFYWFDWVPTAVQMVVYFFFFWFDSTRVFSWFPESSPLSIRGGLFLRRPTIAPHSVHNRAASNFRPDSVLLAHPVPGSFSAPNCAAAHLTLERIVDSSGHGKSKCGFFCYCFWFCF